MTIKLPSIDFVFGEFHPFSPDEAAVSHPQTSGDTAADLSCIGEIFVGAAKLQLSGLDLNGYPWVDSAYTSADEATYHLLKQMDNPNAADLIDIPEFMWREFDPPPLFLQAANF